MLIPGKCVRVCATHRDGERGSETCIFRFAIKPFLMSGLSQKRPCSRTASPPAKSAGERWREAEEEEEITERDGYLDYQWCLANRQLTEKVWGPPKEPQKGHARTHTPLTRLHSVDTEM